MGAPGADVALETENGAGRLEGGAHAPARQVGLNKGEAHQARLGRWSRSVAGARRSRSGPRCGFAARGA